MINVTVWSEHRQCVTQEDVKALYPNDICGAIGDFLRPNSDMNVTVSTLDDPDCGLSQELLDNTDVLIYWAHRAHDEVTDEAAERIQRRVLGGMGAIFLHSAHVSKPFKLLMGTSGALKWYENDDISERIWITEPNHPIVRGLGEFFELPHEEMYGERFDIPAPDELIMLGWYNCGYVFRSGCCWNRGNGKVFYFQPGHEQFPTYYDKNIQTVITNAVRWAAPTIEPKNDLNPQHVGAMPEIK